MARRIPKPPPTIDPLIQPVHLARSAEPGAARLVLRPFGYLAATIVWSVLFLIVVVVTVFALPAALSSGVAAHGLGASPAFHRSDTWLAFVVIPIFVVPVLGSVSVLLVCATLGLTLCTATLFARSLRPGYRHERLSVTLRSRGGEAVGPATTALTGVGLSFLPLRLTRWTKIAMIIQFNGWIVNANLFVIGVIWGCLYLFTIGWMLWPATGAAIPVCIVVSGLLLVWLLATLWRRRGSYARVMPDALRGTPYEWSWPNRIEPRPERRR